jgi:hypothetical protein
MPSEFLGKKSVKFERKKECNKGVIYSMRE